MKQNRRESSMILETPNYIHILFFLLFLPSAVWAQNLIENPGFENGMTNWDTWWTRNPNAGVAAVVDSVRNTGTKSMRVEHWGADDYALRPEQNFEVLPGSFYEFTAYIRCEYVRDYAQMSIAVFDASMNSLDWSFAPVYLENTGGEFVLLSTRFVIPEGCAYINTRFIGEDSCLFFIDDVSLIKMDDPPPIGTFTLENTNLRAVLSLPSFGAVVTDKISGRVYTIKESYEFFVSSATQDQNTLTAECTFLATQADAVVTISLGANGLRFEIAADSTVELSRDLQFPGVIESQPGEFYFIPWSEGMLLPVETEYPYWEFTVYQWKGTAGFSGVTNLETGYLLATEQPYDAVITFVQPQGSSLYTLQMNLQPAKGLFAYNRAVDIFFAPSGGYVTSAKQYRTLAESLGYVRTFAEKQANNPNIAKLAGCFDMYLLSENMSQPAFVDSLYRYGLRQGLLSVSGGWYTQDFSELVDSINAKGFLSGRYDIFTDVWPPTHPEYPWYRTEGYPEDVIVQEDGSLMEGWLSYLDDGSPFQGYYVCSATHENYARQRIGEDLANTNYTFRFIDVEMSSPLVECFSSVHPTTRKQDGLYRYQTFEMLQDEFNLVVGSEEARDFTFPFCDYGEGTMSIMPPDSSGYDWLTPDYNPGQDFIDYNMNGARRIPLRSLIYHDVHTATWYTGDGISKTPDYWDTKDLLNALYASMTLAIPPDDAYWYANKERFLTSFFLTGAVYRNAGFEPMTNHRFLTDDRLLQETEFANGWKVYGNFGNTQAGFGDYLLDKDGFWATNGTFEVVRSRRNGTIVSAAYTDDLLFLNPGGAADVFYKGIVSEATIALRKEENSISVSLIGDQNWFDLYTDELPWLLGDFQVLTSDGYAATVEDLGNNQFRIHKFGDEIFYTILSDSIITGTSDDALALEYSLAQNYPNPFNASTVIRYSLKDDTHASLCLYDVLGNLVVTVFDGQKKRGTYETSVDLTGLASGVYFYRLQTESFTDVKKLSLVK